MDLGVGNIPALAVDALPDPFNSATAGHGAPAHAAAVGMISMLPEQPGAPPARVGAGADPVSAELPLGGANCLPQKSPRREAIVSIVEALFREVRAALLPGPGKGPPQERTRARALGSSEFSRDLWFL